VRLVLPPEQLDGFLALALDEVEEHGRGRCRSSRGSTGCSKTCGPRHCPSTAPPSSAGSRGGSSPSSEPVQPNTLRLALKPDRVVLEINVNGPGDPFELEPSELDLTLPDHEVKPYSLLLADILDAEPTLAIRADEAEEGWRIVEPVPAAWDSGTFPLSEYPAGSEGPDRLRS
jgi:hypothetical protein